MEVAHYKNKAIENLIEVFEGVTYVEEWRHIEGYENIYSVSTFGRVKSLSRIMKVCGVDRFSNKNIILSQTFTVKKYVAVKLCKNGKHKSLVVHRLVGKSYIPNPNNLPEINHIKGIKTDNRVHQLEWNTHTDNMRHSFRIGLNKNSDKAKAGVTKRNKLRVGAKHYMSRVVLNTETGIYYVSAREAAESISMNVNTLYPKLNGRGHSSNNTPLIYV